MLFCAEGSTLLLSVLPPEDIDALGMLLCAEGSTLLLAVLSPEDIWN